MNQENHAVEETQVVESVQADAAQAPAEQDPTVIALTDLIAEKAEEATEEEAQEPAAEEQAQEEQKPMNGGIKGRLLESEEKGRKRGYNDGYAAAKAEFEAEKAKMTERLAKLDELELQEAAKKIEQEEGCSAALAMRLARLERGLPPQTTAPTNTQPRDASGRFVKAEAQGQTGVDPKVQALFDQAQTVTRATGIDVLDIFNSNDEVKRRIASGEIDFADVAREYGQQERKKAPPVVRTSAGSTVKARGFADLSDEAFDQMQAELSKGRMIDLRR